MTLVLLTSIIAFIGAVGICFVYYSKEAPIFNQTQADKSVPLEKNQPWVQLLNIAGRVSLIEIRLNNIGIQNHDRLILQIKDSQGNLLRRLIISGSNIRNDEWVKFKFDPAVQLNGVSNLEITATELTSNSPVYLFMNNQNQWNLRVFLELPILESFLKVKQDFTDRFNFDRVFATIYYLLLVSLIIYKGIKLYYGK